MVTTHFLRPGARISCLEPINYIKKQKGATSPLRYHEERVNLFYNNIWIILLLEINTTSQHVIYG